MPSHYKLEDPELVGIARAIQLQSALANQSGMAICIHATNTGQQEKTNYTLLTQHPHLCAKILLQPERKSQANPSNIVPFSHHQRNMGTRLFLMPTTSKILQSYRVQSIKKFTKWL